MFVCAYVVLNICIYIYTERERERERERKREKARVETEDLRLGPKQPPPEERVHGDRDGKGAKGRDHARADSRKRAPHRIARELLLMNLKWDELETE